MILSSADLTTPNLMAFGEMLMEKSDDLSDWLWEECGGDADGIIPNATLGISVSIDREKRMNTFKLGVVDRKRPFSLINVAIRGDDVDAMWWIPIDEYVGKDGNCTLAEVVEWLGGDEYAAMLRHTPTLRKVAVDMLKRYPTEGSA